MADMPDKPDMLDLPDTPGTSPELPWARLIADARHFLGKLAQNNSRDWFNDHKPDYEAGLKAPALALLDSVAADLHRSIGSPVTAKLWRPHRDVRFSKDKTPYHLHLHMGWSSQTDGGQPLGWFFGISPDYVTAGAGVMGFDKPGLEAWRKAVDGAAGAALERRITALLAQGMRIDDPELKRVPAPYDKQHPRGGLLRRKGVVLWSDWPSGPTAAQPTDPQDWLRQVFTALEPLQSELRKTL